jgi:hypothetical protein
MTTDAGRILVTRPQTGTLGGLAQLLWWDPSVRFVLVERDDTADVGTDYWSYVADVRSAIELTGSDALLLVPS